MNHKVFLLEELYKMRDFSINMIPNNELAAYYQTWIDQIRDGCVKDIKLHTWIQNQIAYWGPKDRAYSKFLESYLMKI